MSLTKRIAYLGRKVYKDRGLTKGPWRPGEARDVPVREADQLLAFPEFKAVGPVENAYLWPMNSLHGAWYMKNQGVNPELPGHKFEAHPDSLDGSLVRITTKAGTDERKKLSTIYSFGAGVFKWRCFVSDLRDNDQCSIGCWLYKDDTHELDFEIYHGKAADRVTYKAKPDEVLVMLSSQGLPPYNKVVLIKKNAWHDFEIDLTTKVTGDGPIYAVTWRIDGKVVGSVDLYYGQGHPFRMYCSVENLTFTGDHLPYNDNYGLFDAVSYTPKANSIAPFMQTAPPAPA